MDPQGTSTPAKEHDLDTQKQRAILSNLLAKLNISGYESKGLMIEPAQHKKFAPHPPNRPRRESLQSASAVLEKSAPRQAESVDDSEVNRGGAKSDLGSRVPLLPPSAKAEERKNQPAKYALHFTFCG